MKSSSVPPDLKIEPVALMSPLVLFAKGLIPQNYVQLNLFLERKPSRKESLTTAEYITIINTTGNSSSVCSHYGYICLT